MERGRSFSTFVLVRFDCYMPMEVLLWLWNIADVSFDGLRSPLLGSFHIVYWWAAFPLVLSACVCRLYEAVSLLPIVLCPHILDAGGSVCSEQTFLV